MVSVNMREMLEAGVHFGHQVRKWNPKMKPYIYGKKNGIYIINLQTSIELFKTALSFIADVVASGEEALIVGTKKQAQAIITEISEDTGMHYVNNRWLGGLLTNFNMIKKSIDKLIDLDEMKQDGRWEVKSKKEQSRLEKRYKKLHKNLWGMRNIKRLPGVVIVIDSTFEEIAIFEAKKLNIPIVGIVDTNANPEGISYPVPGNDDAIRSIKLFTSKFGEAVRVGLERRISDSLNQEQNLEAEIDETDEEPAEILEAIEPKPEVEAVEDTAVAADEEIAEEPAKVAVAEAEAETEKGEAKEEKEDAKGE
jgi:small subunit ribosomal protein S2